MNIKNKTFIFALMLLASSSAYADLKILEDGKDKSKELNASNEMILRDDFEKKKKRSDEKYAKYEANRKTDVADYRVNSYHDSDIMGRTGIFFDYDTKEDDLAPSNKVSGKKLTIINGNISSAAMPYSYDGTNRVGIIENSDINIVRDKAIFYLFGASGKYDPGISTSKVLPDEYKIRAPREDRYRPYYNTEVATLPGIPIDVYNSKLIFKNSSIKTNSEDVNEFSSPALNITPYFYNPSLKDVKTNKNYAGVEFQRDKKNSGVYDLDTNLDLRIYSIHELSPGDSLFKDDATPFLKFGSNTKVRARVLKVEGSMFNHKETMRYYNDQLPMVNLKHNPSIIFEKDSEVELDGIEANGGVNIYFDGGKVSIGNRWYDSFTNKRKKVKTRKAVSVAYQGIIQGSAIFNVYGIDWQDGHNYFPGMKSGLYTNLTALPGSKFDLHYLSSDTRNGLNSIEKAKIPNEADRGSLFKFTFEKDTDLYLSQVSDAQMVFNKGSRIHLSSEYDKDNEIKLEDKLEHADWQDYERVLGKKGRYGEAERELSGLDIANYVQFRDKLTLNEADIYFRTNIAKQVADRLVVKNEQIEGDGTTTLHIKNQGGIDTTGKEKIVLIQALRGVADNVRFALNTPKITVGAFDYELDSSTVDNGKEYFLISTLFKNQSSDDESGVMNDDHNNTKKTIGKNINPVKDEDFNLIKETSTINSNKGNIAIDLTNKKANIENSTLVVNDGKGIKLENSPMVIKNSSITVDTRDTNTGITIKGDENTKKLLVIEKDKANDSKDLYVNGRVKIIGNAVDDTTNVEFGKNTNIEIYNPKGDYALNLVNTTLEIKDNNTTLDSKNAIYSKGAKIIGNGVFNIKGNIVHEANNTENNGIDLTFKNGSDVDIKSIQIEKYIAPKIENEDNSSTEDTENTDTEDYNFDEEENNDEDNTAVTLSSETIDIPEKNNEFNSQLHFEKGSTLRLSYLSNTNLKLDEGSKLYLYNASQENEKLFDRTLEVINQINEPDPSLYNFGNSVYLTGKTEFNNVDIYPRANFVDNLADKIVVKGENALLTGKGARFHFKNIADTDASNLRLRMELFRGNLDENFKWDAPNELEIGGYVYNPQLKLDVQEINVGDEKNPKIEKTSILTYELPIAAKRTVKLSSTADSFIENTFADYYTELGTTDSVFRGIDTVDFTKKDNVWAKVDGVSLTTKNQFKATGKTVLAGIDRQLGNLESLHGGVFFGDTQTDKTYSKFSGKGKSNIFHAGLYLTYRGLVGDGDFILKYSTGKTDYNVLDTAGDRISNKYDYKSKMVGFRFAKKFYPMGKGLYVEPSVKASYGEIDAVDAKASNGLNTKVKNIRTWSTGGELRAGYMLNGLNTYAKVGIAKEFLGDVDVNFNQKGEERRQLDEGMLTLGAGLEYTVGSHSLSLEAERKQSKLLKDFYRVSLGYKYKF